MAMLPRSKRSRAPRPPRSVTAAIKNQRPVQRQNLAYSDNLRILDYFHLEQPSRGTQVATVRHFRSEFPKFSEAMMSKLLASEQEIRAYYQAHPERLAYKRPLHLSLPEVDEAVCLWIQERFKHGLLVTGVEICDKARQFCEEWGIPDRQKLEFSHASSAPVDRIAAKITRLQGLLGLRPPRDNYNFDESALYFRRRRTHGLGFDKMSGFKEDKSRLSLGLCTNEDGSDKRELLFIGYYEKPRPFGGQTGAALGYDYEFNPTAWMNGKVWTRWILRFDAEMRQQNRNVLLLCDNAPSHKKFDRTRLTNVQLEFLAPNLTAFIQPLDAGIIRCFKAHYHRGLLKKAIERDTAGHADPYRINQLEGMLLAKEAWNAVKPSTIINCWRHTGICPPNLPPTPDPSDSVMAELQAQLDYAGIPVSAAEWVGYDQYTDTEQPLTDELIAKAVGVQPEIHQAMI
ncbi:tigger transposable element-derived protein 6 [Ceratobasidium sp. AG-Ba]|nr:tigger transposable element-derived protein 6 [Ceratobasidium sp. AG-Ba]